MLLFNVIVPILLYVTFHPQVNLLRFSFGKNRLWTGRGGGTGGGELPAEGPWEYRMKRYGISHLLRTPFGRAGLGAQPAVLRATDTAAALVGILSARCCC